MRNNNNNNAARKKSPKRSKSPKKAKTPANMTVICNRVNLYDCASKKHHYHDHLSDDDNHHNNHLPHPNLPVAPYYFAPDADSQLLFPEQVQKSPLPHPSVAVVRAPQFAIRPTASQQFQPSEDVIDNEIPNPHPQHVCHDKYWAQRRRLFSKFDMGIQLDPEGWYSVTPEVIANHVAQRVGDLSQGIMERSTSSLTTVATTAGMIVMDAFCGCGGNAIAFGKQSHISMVVCADIDRTKLRKAAYNACLYEIPPEKLIFVECSSLFILEHCYQDGVLCIDKLRNSTTQNVPLVETEVVAGFFIGGLGMLPPRIDAVFMDPPWGGVDYNSLGKNGYCLEKHMKIHKGVSTTTTANNNVVVELPEEEAKPAGNDALGDDFFDSFGPSSHGGNNNHHHHNHNKKNKQKFNQKTDESEYLNGVDLLKVAASATKCRLVIYDMPRNTSKTSLCKCALAAGYRGNLKLEEHYLNGRLKTVTAYMGVDYSPILFSATTAAKQQQTSSDPAAPKERFTWEKKNAS